jgi:hypothetical protein
MMDIMDVKITSRTVGVICTVQRITTMKAADNMRAAHAVAVSKKPVG